MIPVSSPEDLGKLIRDERKRKGYTQTKLARYAGVGINFVSHLERGKETAELGKALQVLKTLGIDLFAQRREG